jgi:hypothetical protein
LRGQGRCKEKDQQNEYGWLHSFILSSLEGGG